MLKRIIGQNSQKVSPEDQHWLDLDALAQVEVTSEDAAHPIESGLLPGDEAGWRAAQPGPQTVRLLFDQPQRIERMRLEFHERELERTQQFVLRWSSNGGQSYREIVRQQYNFSPPATTSECEDYSVDLDGVTTIELNIVPDISGGAARASLAQLRLG
ncbi:MAG TPA: hypothetical protein VLA17_09165 [Candidatus Limnocylindria bacterium]|nr:hypothetical protein [Candidatus Limnocylindria bacterium]